VVGGGGAQFVVEPGDEFVHLAAVIAAHSDVESARTFAHDRQSIE
jgi:hypothetical protein